MTVRFLKIAIYSSTFGKFSTKIKLGKHKQANKTNNFVCMKTDNRAVLYKVGQGFEAFFFMSLVQCAIQQKY